MKTARLQLNKTLENGSEAETSSANSSKPKADALAPTETAQTAQTEPSKRRVSFWETAYYWVMARR